MLKRFLLFSFPSGLRKIILPVVWFADGIDGIEDERTLALLRAAVLTPETARSVMYPSLLVLGAVAVAAAVACAAYGGRRRKRKGR